MQIPFSDYCGRVEQQVVGVYGIRVVTRDIPDPLTGDLDGLEIHIDHTATPEQRLFLLSHLFGHAVQWNLDARNYEVGRQVQPPVDEVLIPEILQYEGEAAGYGLEVLHQAGVGDADQWISAYTACDQAYLVHFYRTGEKRDFQSFWKDSVPPVRIKPVPHFTPTRRRFRMDGIVI